jgi:5-hydroxyisourate hydrolase
MSPITTHVLDTRVGRPAAGVRIILEAIDATGAWKEIASGATNDDGRAANLLSPGTLTAGRHRLTFDTGAYFKKQQIEHFYPRVTIEFDVAAPEQHYHVPLLLSPFGYSTYRGS